MIFLTPFYEFVPTYYITRRMWYAGQVEKMSVKIFDHIVFRLHVLRNNMSWNIAPWHFLFPHSFWQVPKFAGQSWSEEKVISYSTMEHSHISFVFVSRSSKFVICDLWTAQMWNAFFRVGSRQINFALSRENNNQQYQKTSVQKTADIGLWPGRGQQLPWQR